MFCYFEILSTILHARYFVFLMFISKTTGRKPFYERNKSNSDSQKLFNFYHYNALF